MAEEENNQIEKVFSADAAEWPIRNVTVYTNQAEVQRSLSFRPETEGTYSLKLRGLPNTINQNSIRADISSNNSRLLEVSYETETEQNERDPKIDEEVKLLREENEDFRKELTSITEQITKINEHKAALRGSLNKNATDTEQVLLKTDVLGKLKGADKFYSDLLQKLQLEQKKINDGIQANSKKINELTTTQNRLVQVKTFRTVTLLVEVPEILITKSKKTLDVELFYLVSGASWLPEYDIKVDKEADGLALLSYYGQVKNNTNEDWVEVEMKLSTANPNASGSLPPLARMQVDFSSAYVGHTLKKAARSRHWDKSTFVSNTGLTASASKLDNGTAVFRLPRLANIDSDNKPHRQTISLVELKAFFAHVASPKQSPNVFLKMTTTNHSDYLFLPGKLGVFLDGNFVTNSNMKLVLPNDEFNLFLGIDDSVKLGYAPEKTTKKTVNRGGLRKKQLKWHKTISREITVINNNKNDINCCIYEQFPSAPDSKIKLKLLQPDLSAEDKKAKHKLNTSNNLETTTTVQPGQMYKMVFEYSIEWPEGQEIQLFQE